MAKKSKAKTSSTRPGHDPRDILIALLFWIFWNECGMSIEHLCLFEYLASIPQRFLLPSLQIRIASTVADSEHEYRVITERKLKSKLPLGGPIMNRNLRKIIGAIIRGIGREAIMAIWIAFRVWFDDDNPPGAPR